MTDVLALEEKFAQVESSQWFLDLRIRSAFSRTAQNAELLKNVFTQEELTAFRTWQDLKELEKHLSENSDLEPWSARDIGIMLDNISNQTTPEQLKELEQDFKRRPRPHILLGNCNGVGIRLRVTAFALDQTYKSLEVTQNGHPAEASKNGEGRPRVPLLLSLYRNAENEDEDSGAPYWLPQSSGDDDDDAPSILPVQEDLNLLPTDSQDVRINKILEASELMASERMTNGGPASASHWEYYAMEGRNRLESFLPLGWLEVGGYPSTSNNWWQSQWHLVVNTYDKRPWIVFNPYIRSGYGADDVYVPAGQRLSRFCWGESLQSHARLQFFTPEGVCLEPRDPPPRPYGEARRASALPADFWQNLFANEGSLEHQIKAEPIFQDNYFVLGWVVWDAQKHRLYRAFDTKFFNDEDKAINDFLHTFTDDSPPTKLWENIEETPLHDRVPKAAA